MVLVSVQSIEDNNGYEFKNDFAESLIIDPKSTISVVNLQFTRKAEFVILSTGNAFEIQVGSRFNPTDVIGIAPNTYTATTLAAELQLRLNNAYHAIGHNFDVEYNFKSKTFEIRDNYMNLPLEGHYVVNWDTEELTKVESATALSNNLGTLRFGTFEGYGPITNGTANYTQSTSLLETDLVPTLADGGSFAEFRLDWTTVNPFPRTGAGPPATYGLVMGLAVEFSDTAPATGVKEVSDIANLGWLDCGIVLFTDTAGNPHIRIVEGGQDINAIDRFIANKKDKYRIILSADGADGINGYPVYQFKRDGGNWEAFNLTHANQVFGARAWRGLKLSPVLACDFNDGANPGPTLNAWVCSAGQTKLKPVVLTAGDNDQRKLNHTYNEEDHTTHQGVLTRSQTVGADLATLNQGFITQRINADSFSQIEFSLPTTTEADFYVSILDEEVRNLNQTAEGGDATDMGVADSAWGNSAKDNFIAETVPNRNPALASFRFMAWDDPTNSNYASKKIYCRLDMNSYNQKVGGKVLGKWADIDPDDDFDWHNEPNALFVLKCLGAGNGVELWVSRRGDKSDLKLLVRKDLPSVNLTGAKTLTNPNTTTPFSASQTGAIFTLSTPATHAGVFTADTDGGGNIDVGSVKVIVAGNNYVAGQTYAVLEIDVNGDQVGNGAGTIDIASLVDYNRTGGMGTHYDSDKAVNGYSYWFCFGNKDANDGGAVSKSEVKNLCLYTQSDDHQSNYVKFNPRYETIFGDTLGFNKNEYTLNSNADKIVSDKDPVPNQQSSEQPTIMLNVDNLPINSYIGKRYKADAGINDLPVGNQQGLTRMVAKVPRHHDDQGDGSGASVGPYYYDYFPYSVPLHNATELVLNELELSVRNPDGTLATDILQTHALLNISNVDSVGEGLTRGRVGNPKLAPNSYDKLNVPKGQLQPSINNDFGGARQASKPTDTEDPWGHGKLGADKSHAL